MVSVWHRAQRVELHEHARKLHAFERPDKQHVLAATTSGLWLITEWAASERARVAFRVAFAPGELAIDSVAVAEDRSSVDVEMSSTIGSQHAHIEIDRADGTVTAWNSLHPAEALTVEGWPRDIVPDLDDVEITVHTSQRGLRTGLVYASLTAPVSAAFMYLQDLTLLGDYCHATHASAGDTVGGEWPDLGFALPAGKNPMPVGESVRVSSWHVAFADEACRQPAQVAEQYLELLARLFMHIERPTPGYVDWRQRAEQCRADLDKCKDCWMAVEGTRYLRAYVGDATHPPESMVQLAVLVPLYERSDWMGSEDPVASELAAATMKFQDDRVRSIARWLPAAEDMLDGTEPHEHPRLMDSWYVFHPLLNLGRLAIERDDGRARKLFLDSLDTLIGVAHHFGYQWPVFYDVDTLDVIKAESEPGKGGELDVPGLYAHVMTQAFELTEDERYLNEALAAIRSLNGRGFEMTYQTNNIAFGMLAALRLHQHTGDEGLLAVSHVLCACLLDNVGMWATRYGHARDRASFFGVFPMPTAPYTAAYEQAEVSAACLDYILRAGDELPASLNVLLPEFIRHVTARLDTYYPPQIADEALSDSPKTGHIDPELWIPVEDIGDGWDQAGTVGQEVYGAGIAFSTVARSYLKVPDSSTQVYCEYPIRLLEADRRCVVFHVCGDDRLSCRVRLLADGEPLANAVLIGSASGELRPASEGDGWRDYCVAAGQQVTLRLA